MALTNNDFIPNIFVPLFIEYQSVAKRIGPISGLGQDDIDAIPDYVLSQSSIREIFYLWRPCLKDPKDDLALEVTVESGSTYIITFNKSDFAGCEKFGIEAVTPQEFIRVGGI